MQTSKDRDLLETFKTCLGTSAGITASTNALRVQIHDVGLYRWLESIGLTPRKSLTLGAVAVPERFFADFVRGLLDGDGTITTSLTVPNRARYPEHTYQRLRVQFISASERHIVWLREMLSARIGLKGWVTVRPNTDETVHRAPLHILRYSKHESVTLLEWLYADPTAPRLERKWQKWLAYRDHGKPTRSWHHVA